MTTPTQAPANTAVGASACGGTHDRGRSATCFAIGRGAGSGLTTANPRYCHRNQCSEREQQLLYRPDLYERSAGGWHRPRTRVTINSNGRLGRGNVSSRRYKHDIQPIHTASESIYEPQAGQLSLPQAGRSTQTIAFGLIAEEVAEVHPDLVGRNPEGLPESVRYEQINAMLLNEFLKEHAKVQQLKKDFASKFAEQQTQIEALTAGLRKVSAQIEMKTLAPNVARNNP